METLHHTQTALGNTNTHPSANGLNANANTATPTSSPEAKEEQLNAQRQANANADMWAGAFWCIGGILITAVSYNAVKDTGGTYIITWGAVVYGGYQFLKGLFNAIT